MPLGGRCRVEAGGRALGARRPRERVRRHAVGALPPARHRRTASRRRDAELAVCGARCERAARARARHARGRRGRGARRRQRDAADQPHLKPEFPAERLLVVEVLHAVRQLVELPAAQARRGPAARRGRARGDLLLPHARAPEAFAVQRLYSPRHGARRDGDRARRRPDARAVRLPHDRRRARLRPLLPERARGRPALDGRGRRPGARLDPRRVGRPRAGSARAARDVEAAA